MLPEIIYLIDFDNNLVDAWIEAFASDKIIQPICGDYFSKPADGIVSPANSFGFMDGGLDLAIRNVLGFEIENRIKNEIVSKYHGELPIGSALVIPTNNEKWPFMISAPTMRLPQDVSNTLNAYLAFRAILLAVKDFNSLSSKPKIRTLVCSGLGTGIGNISAKKCAIQMKYAYQYLYSPSKIPNVSEIRNVHKAMNNL